MPDYSVECDCCDDGSATCCYCGEDGFGSVVINMDDPRPPTFVNFAPILTRTGNTWSVSGYSWNSANGITYTGDFIMPCIHGAYPDVGTLGHYFGGLVAAPNPITFALTSWSCHLSVDGTFEHASGCMTLVPQGPLEDGEPIEQPVSFRVNCVPEAPMRMAPVAPEEPRAKPERKRCGPCAGKGSKGKLR